MPKHNVNLSLEEAALARGRRYSQRHGTSISRLVNDFLAQLPEEEETDHPALSPTVRRLLGVAAAGPDEEDYHRHLMEKYAR